MRRIVVGARRRWLWIWLLIVALGAAGVTTWYVLSRPSETNGPTTAVVTRRDLSASVIAIGTIKPTVGAEVKVGSRIPGRVEHLAVQVGDHVEVGQVIARLEQEELRAAVEKARADLVAAEANRLLAQGNLERYRQLYQDGGIPLQTVDTAARDYDVAVAQVGQARATLQMAEANLGYATITAPMSGVVASVSTQQGETVVSGSAAAQAPTFVTIIDLARLQVDAYVDETDIGKVHAGQEATFTVDAYPDKEFQGDVTAIYPKALIQQNVVTYDVVIAIDNREGLLRPDMTATTTITVAKREKILTVPNQAVRREDGERVAYVQEGDGFARRPIRTGWRDRSYTEVVNGLREGERVIVGEVEGIQVPLAKGSLPPGAK